MSGIIRAMIPLLEEHREAIAALCRKYGVTRLEVFGSAVNGTFDPARSDVDFLYEIETESPRLADRYFDFSDELRRLVGKEVDLVYYPQVTNRYFRAQVDAERVLYYAA